MRTGRCRTVRGIVAGVAAAALHVGAAAAPPDTDGAAGGVVGPVQVAPRMRVGERRELTIYQERRHLDLNGRELDRSRVRLPCSIEVLEDSEAGWVVAWSIGLPRVEGPALTDAEQAQVDELVGGLGLPVMRLAVGRDGSVRLLNLAEVRDEGFKAAERALQWIDADAAPEARRAALAAVRDLFSEPEMMELMLLKKPLVYFSGYGYELAPGGEIREVVVMPAPHSGGLEFDSTTRMIAAPGSPGVYTVSLTAALTEAGRGQLLEFISSTAERLAPADQAAEVPPGWNIEIIDRYEWTYDSGTGWITDASMSRRMTSNDGREGGTRIDSLTFTLEPERAAAGAP